MQFFLKSCSTWTDFFFKVQFHGDIHEYICAWEQASEGTSDSTAFSSKPSLFNPREGFHSSFAGHFTHPRCCWPLLYHAILCSQADSLCLHMILHSPFTRQGSFRGVVAARGRAGGVWAIVHQGTGTTDPWHGRLAPAVDVSALCCPPVLRLAQWTAKWGWCWKLRIQSNNNFTSDLIISHLIQTLYIKCTNWRGKMSTKLCFFQSVTITIYIQIAHHHTYLFNQLGPY